MDISNAMEEMRCEGWNEGKLVGEKRGEQKGITLINQLNSTLIDHGERGRNYGHLCESREYGI